MCLVLEWNTGLEARARAELLSHQRTGMWGRKSLRSLKGVQSHANSTAVEAKAQYSASVEDHETVDCFLEDQEIGLEPRKITMPVVDFLSVGSLAQSTSEKAEKVRGPGAKWMPKCKVPLTYQRTRLAASKWDEVGVFINWQSWCTLKAKSGHVKVKYWRAPTMLLYSEGSGKNRTIKRGKTHIRAAKSFCGLGIFHVEPVKYIWSIFGLA